MDPSSPAKAPSTDHDPGHAWEEFVVASVYPEPGTKAKADYRNYDAPARDTVREFYRENHRHQTYDFVQRKRREFLALERKRMSVFEACDFLNTLVDDSDPDIELDQLQHLLQTSEAIRRDGHEDWFVLVGLLHDLGKVLCLYGEPQWAVVGDTFPVGCRHSERIVYHEFFADNPDSSDPRYNTRARRVHGRLRPQERADVLGTRRVPVPRDEELSARAGPVHDSLPLVLRVASRG